MAGGMGNQGGHEGPGGARWTGGPGGARSSRAVLRLWRGCRAVCLPEAPLQGGPGDQGSPPNLVMQGEAGVRPHVPSALPRGSCTVTLTCPCSGSFSRLPLPRRLGRYASRCLCPSPSADLGGHGRTHPSGACEPASPQGCASLKRLFILRPSPRKPRGPGGRWQRLRLLSAPSQPRHKY